MAQHKGTGSTGVNKAISDMAVKDEEQQAIMLTECYFDHIGERPSALSPVQAPLNMILTAFSDGLFTASGCVCVCV